jgi:hypothetical protein
MCIHQIYLAYLATHFFSFPFSLRKGQTLLFTLPNNVFHFFLTKHSKLISSLYHDIQLYSSPRSVFFFTKTAKFNFLSFFF